MILVDEPHRRPRVLQLAYACSPVRGSEAGVGWHRAIQAAKHFDTWVICEEHEFAGEIRHYLAEHGDIPNLNFVFVPMDRRTWAWGNLHDASWYFVLHQWHRRAYETAKQLHARYKFDLTHQVTFCGYREPGYLWKLDAPFLWGPIGGTQNYPWRFLPAAGFRRAVQEACRSIVNLLQLRFSPRVWAAARKASLILAANATIQSDFDRALGVMTQRLLETGLDRVRSPDDIPPEHQSPSFLPQLMEEGNRSTSRCAGDEKRPIHLLWSGKLMHCKALHLLIEALAIMPRDVSYELRILGNGSLRHRWQRLAERRGVAPHITWIGHLPFHEAMRQYDWADLFAFTSLRETTGNVVLEALAAGVPVLCLDHHGMHHVITDQCGVKIPVRSPKQVAVDLRNAIVRLAQNREELNRLRRGAIERAKTYLWSHQESEMTAIYRSLIGVSNPSRPTSLSRIVEDGGEASLEKSLAT